MVHPDFNLRIDVAYGMVGTLLLLQLQQGKMY